MGGEHDRISAAEAASALAWWMESGVDVAVQDAARDWLSPAVPAPPQAAPAAAPERALPESLEHFRNWLRDETALPLAGAGARRVLPKGAEAAEVMLLTDMPTPEDVADDQPIGGDAWALTERMLAAIGLSAEQAYCAALSCFHNPGARLSPKELEECAAIARRHIALARPGRLLLLGDAPARALLGKPLVTARGHVHRVEGVRTVATFHPRHLLKRPSDKALAWRDLLLLTEDRA